MPEPCIVELGPTVTVNDSVSVTCGASLTAAETLKV
jgi:hypothetical protein